MKSKLFLGVFLLTAFAAMQAQTITSFESEEGFIEGAIDGQNGWSLYTGTPDENAVITSNQYSDQAYSLGLISTNAQPDGLYGAFSPLYDDVTGSYEISQDIYTDMVDADSGSNGYIYAFDYVSSLTVVSEVVFNYDGTILVYDEDSADADDNGYVAVGSFEAAQWYTVTLRYNDGASIDYYINGTWVHNGGAPNGTTVNLFGFFFDDWATSYYVDSLVYNSELSVKSVTASQFSVSPNPANNLVTIANGDNILVNKVSVTDINGRVVKTVAFDGVAQAQVNVADLANGVYMMTISSDKGAVTKKIVKN
ncbi:MAG: T9SS type A sorting domain-containing protein [Bacteroidota bacterium]